LPDSGTARLHRAFGRNSRRFAEHLSSLLTRTITDQPLRERVLFDRETQTLNALILFRDTREVVLANGCRIRLLHRVTLSSDDPAGAVSTAEYSYAYGFGDNLDEGWLVRYDYVPEEAEFNPEYKYPVGHVHFNGRSAAYEAFEAAGTKPLHRLHFPTRCISLEDFIEHLVVEMGVPTRHGQESALELLADSRNKFAKEKRTRD